MILQEQISQDLKEALKSGDAIKVSTLRLLVAAFHNMEIEKHTQGGTEEKDYQAVVKREAKKRQEAIEAYKTAGRTEAQQQEEAELAILSQYLPEEMSEEEIKKIIEEVISEKGTDNLGMIIGEVVKRSDGRADGGLVSKLVKERVG